MFGKGYLCKVFNRLIYYASRMIRNNDKKYERPASRLVPVSVEIVFCGPSTGEAFSGQIEYDSENGWETDL